MDLSEQKKKIEELEERRKEDILRIKRLFESEDGQKVLQLLRNKYTNYAHNISFEKDINGLQLAYRTGQASVITFIDSVIKRGREL
jgi:hypothetical protein